MTNPARSGPRTARRRRVLVALSLVVVGLGLLPGASGASGSPGASATGYAQIIQLEAQGGPSHCQLATVDLEAGTVYAIGPNSDISTVGCPFDMAFRADGRLYAVLNFGPVINNAEPSELVTIDPRTGARNLLGSLGFATRNGGLAFDAAGTLWLYAESMDSNCAGGVGQSCLYRLDPAHGIPTLVGTGNASDQAIGATASCDAVLANQLVQASMGPPSGRLVTLNTVTAAFRPAPQLYGAILMVGLEIDSGGLLRGLAFSFDNTGNPQSPATYAIDRATGVATKIADATPLASDRILAALAIAGPTRYSGPSRSRVSPARCRNRSSARSPLADDQGRGELRSPAG